jgi:hypothetical protein
MKRSKKITEKLLQPFPFCILSPFTCEMNEEQAKDKF